VEVAGQAAAGIAMGSCASWGGVPSADPNPTGAVGVDYVVSAKPIFNLPGCPPNPYNLLAPASSRYAVNAKADALIDAIKEHAIGKNRAHDYPKARTWNLLDGETLTCLR
jgi:Ni,Fe-hydrogenase I small subunit